MSAPSLVWSALLNPLAAIVAFDGGKKILLIYITLEKEQSQFID
jgi:hypothetical protein